MADANTALYGFIKPEVGASADTWGGKLNADFDDLDTLLGATATTGSSNAYVLTTGLSLTAPVNGQRFCVKWNFTNTGAATLNVDALGAIALRKRDGSTALESGDTISGQYGFVVYDSAAPCFRVIGLLASEFQPLDATLTAIAGASIAANKVLGFSGTDVVFLYDVGTSGAALPLLNGGNTWSAQQTYALDGTTIFRRTTATPFLLQLETNSTLRGFIGADATYCFIAYDTGGTARARVNNSTGAMDLGGADVVTVSGAQTLTNKTINGGTSSAAVQTSGEASGTLTSASLNKRVACTGNVTLPSSGYVAGDVIVIDPGGTARTITRPGGHTMYVNNVNVATGTTGAHNIVSAMYHGSSKWTLQGSVS